MSPALEQTDLEQTDLGQANLAVEKVAMATKKPVIAQKPVVTQATTIEWPIVTQAVIGRNLAALYDIWSYKPSYLADTDNTFAPPLLALVGHYAPSTARHQSRLLCVAFAMNFGLREPGCPFTVGLLRPTPAAPILPRLSHLIGYALREAAVSPARFQPDLSAEDSLSAEEASFGELTVLTCFAEPNGRPLEKLFTPNLPRPTYATPTRLRLKVPNLARYTYALTVTFHDCTPTLWPRGLAVNNAVINKEGKAVWDPRPTFGVRRILPGKRRPPTSIAPLDLFDADPAALLASDPARYGATAAERARRLLLYGVSRFYPE